jgi:carboxymethylenebutenolidase
VALDLLSGIATNGGPTPDQITADLSAAGKVYEPVTYEDAGHGFMRAGEDP